MGRFVLKRLALLLPVLFGVVTLVFLLLHLIPGDPVDIMLGDYAQPADRQALHRALGLHQPLHQQYLGYLGDVLRGDLGTSIHSRRPVRDEILERFPKSAELMLAAMAVALLVSLPLGILAALKANTAVDGGARVLALLGVSIPNFWLGPMLVWLPIEAAV